MGYSLPNLHTTKRNSNVIDGDDCDDTACSQDFLHCDVFTHSDDHNKPTILRIGQIVSKNRGRKSSVNVKNVSGRRHDDDNSTSRRIRRHQHGQTSFTEPPRGVRSPSSYWHLASIVLLVFLNNNGSIPFTCYASSSASSSGVTATASSSNPNQQYHQQQALPRSNHGNRRRSYNAFYPPWNPSKHINTDGFLSTLYRRVPGEWESPFQFRNHRLDYPVRIRQVPGDGNCLFHSISLCLYHAKNKTHCKLNSDSALQELYVSSQKLRQQAVALLQQPHRRLFLQGRECLRAGELVQAAAQQYGLTSDEYCSSMAQDSVWGGGPEIVALCNYLQRPIHVYELAETVSTSSSAGGVGASTGSTVITGHQGNLRKRFCLRRMACFGSPRFDRNQALCILSADSRFPDLEPGQQLAAGNHFLAVFPLERNRGRWRRRKRLRGGGILFNNGDHYDDILDDEDGFEDTANDVILNNFGRSGSSGDGAEWYHDLGHHHDDDDDMDDDKDRRVDCHDSTNRSDSILPQWMRWWWRQLIHGVDN